jgi:hypothetical protein
MWTRPPTVRKFQQWSTNVAWSGGTPDQSDEVRHGKFFKMITHWTYGVRGLVCIRPATLKGPVHLESAKIGQRLVFLWGL